MIFCNPPIEINRFKFLISHLDCDAIADTREEDTSNVEKNKVKIIAYSESKEHNEELRNYFFSSQEYKENYRILANISSEEVDCID